jgi:hypothetical protein
VGTKISCVPRGQPPGSRPHILLDTAPSLAARGFLLPAPRAVVYTTAGKGGRCCLVHSEAGRCCLVDWEQCNLAQSTALGRSTRNQLPKPSRTCATRVYACVRDRGLWGPRICNLDTRYHMQEHRIPQTAVAKSDLLCCNGAICGYFLTVPCCPDIVRAILANA